MPDDPYSIADLSRLADVTPRTIRYYVAQGLLPAPEAAGPATRYGEGHLARLQLIRRLQRDHLPLADIRARIERLGDDEVRAALDAAESASVEPQAAGDARAYVRQLMASEGIAPRYATRPPGEPGPLLRSPHERLEPQPAGSTYEPRIPDAFPLRETQPAAPPSPGPSPAASPPWPTVVVPAVPRSTTGDRSTWERLSLTPDVELHVRRPLGRRANKQVERLVRIARELFEDET